VKTPVIASAIGGLAEKVANGISGLHFKLGDPLDLLRVMRLAADLKMSEKLRAGIPAVASDTDMARDYLRVFSERAKPPAEMRVVGDAR
jgi:glycosyltransferase involved in cell wall biosynthesis